MGEQPVSLDKGRFSTRWAYPAACAIALVVAGILRAEGRRWWCACGHAWLWAGNIWSQHNSQHLLDPYSISHVSHGLIFFALLYAIRPLRRLHWTWRLVIAVGIEAAWEVLENSPFIIDRYRRATLEMGYQGDSIANSLGDIGSCVVGFLIARYVGWRWAIVLVIALELLSLFWIRDNLTLNVLQLIHPIPAIHAWRVAGH